jgi:hypothetical protein
MAQPFGIGQVEIAQNCFQAAGVLVIGQRQMPGWATAAIATPADNFLLFGVEMGQQGQQQLSLSRAAHPPHHLLMIALQSIRRK